MKMPNIIVFHTAWMAKYDGDNDTIFAGGFRYPGEHGYGHEMRNFSDVDGFCYGYAPSPGELHFEKHFDVPGRPKTLEGTTVVWTAPHPEKGRGRAVVGIWRNATVFREAQTPTGSLARRRSTRGDVFSYLCKAAAEDCTLLPPEERPIFVPSGKRPGGGRWPGMSSVFYPQPGSDALRRLVDIIKGIELADTPAAPRKGERKRSQWQVDVERRHKIEMAAISAVARRLEDMGYTVDSKEKDNLGYDLEAVRGQEILHVEVKGRSGSDICADLSVNEFECLKAYARASDPKAHYRVAIVTDALEKPVITEFVLVGGRPPKWWTLDGRLRLDFEDRVAARVSAVEA